MDSRPQGCDANGQEREYSLENISYELHFLLDHKQHSQEDEETTTTTTTHRHPIRTSNHFMVGLTACAMQLFKNVPCGLVEGRHDAPRNDTDK